MRGGLLKASVMVTVATVVTDVLLINIAFFVAYWIRYTQGIGGEVSPASFVDVNVYFPVQLTLTAIFAAVFTLGGVYRQSKGTTFLDEVIALISSTSVGMMMSLATVFLFQGYAYDTYSRLLLFFFWALTIVLLIMARIVKGLLRGYLRRRGIGVQRALVVGGNTLARRLMHVIATEPRLGYHLVGYVHENGVADVGRFKDLGQVGDLPVVVKEHDIDEVIIALPSTEHHSIPRIADHCRKQNLDFKIVPDLFEMSLSAINTENFHGLPLIGLKPVSIAGMNYVIKRALDFVLSSVLLVLLSPFFTAIALAIKLDSPGPIFFRQTRVGKGGKEFSYFKFRSMKKTAEEDLKKLAALNEVSWPLFKMKNDPRITRVGRFIRRTSLDELPQLFNVLKGEMSLVGPRPPLPRETEMYEDWHMKRLEAAPGITGLWQVSGRSDLPFDEMVLLDIYYIENWSLALDLKTLLRTIPAALNGHGAY